MAAVALVVTGGRANMSVPATRVVVGGNCSGGKVAREAEGEADDQGVWAGHVIEPQLLKIAWQDQACIEGASKEVDRLRHVLAGHFPKRAKQLRLATIELIGERIDRGL